LPNHGLEAVMRNLGPVRVEAAGLSMTEEGANLARRLLIAMREVECGVEEIRADAHQRSGQIRIGAMLLAGRRRS
jgi:DNA-binding transcriptional LysR family regulator